MRTFAVLTLLVLSPVGASCSAPERPPPSEVAAAADVPAASDSLEAEREAMVERQIRARGIEDAAVLEALREVPRHAFVPPDVRPLAYRDRPLPIGYDQTISQPYIVAYMTEMAEIAPGDTVLEIGTGSGYQAAVLGELASAVYTIEIVPELAARADSTLEALGYGNVHVRAGNGYGGWPEHAPFDAIVVTAAPTEVPQTLVDQLAVGGRMVIPVGDMYQEMTVIEKTPEGVAERQTIPVRFVPMTGEPEG